MSDPNFGSSLYGANGDNRQRHSASNHPNPPSAPWGTSTSSYSYDPQFAGGPTLQEQYSYPAHPNNSGYHHNLTPAVPIMYPGSSSRALSPELQQPPPYTAHPSSYGYHNNASPGSYGALSTGPQQRPSQSAPIDHATYPWSSHAPQSSATQFGVPPTNPGRSARCHPYGPHSRPRAPILHPNDPSSLSLAQPGSSSSQMPRNNASPPMQMQLDHHTETVPLKQLCSRCGIREWEPDRSSRSKRPLCGICDSYPGPDDFECRNCKTKESIALWDGEPLCDACGVYKKEMGEDRPLAEGSGTGTVSRHKNSKGKGKGKERR
ncbi:hypothetical protein C8R46DRAFT_426038 [Mycena filopes]|nr:hypothetical protein C8R46DRAFT_426038 [Mycena filopes]